MSHYQGRQSWAIARLLFATHLPLLLALWMIFAIVVAGIISGLAAFGTISFSVWHGATQFSRWFALAYGFYLTRGLLPMYIAYGQTRRDFVIQASLFAVVATVVVSVLMTLGYVLEAVLYRAMGWQQALTAQHPFTSPGQFPLTFIMCMALFLVWIVSGALLGAGFYRSDEWGMITIPFALILISAAAFSVGFDGLPFISNLIARLDAPFLVAVLLSAGSFLLSLVLIWSIVRDIPIRNKTA